MKTVRQLAFAAACAASIFVLQPAAAQEPQKTLDTLALAHIYGETCTDWQVNWLQYAARLEAAGLSVEKLGEGDVPRKMVDAATKASAAIEGKSRDEICRLAETEFGPKGSVAANILSNSLAVRGMNRLFDWLDGD